MASSFQTISDACRAVSRQTRDVYRNLHIHFIVHHSGQRKEALAVAAQDILNHPAAETAIHMLQKIRKSEDSAMLGTAVARKSLFFGLASKEAVISLCTINIDQFESPREAQRYAWHLAWHAIDSLQYHAMPENRSRRSDIILRRRNALEMASANLRADAFSAVICALNGDLSSIKSTAAMRGMNALRTRSLHSPEFYPFLLAREAAEFGYNEIMKKSPSRRRYIPLALKLASDIGRTIDAEALRHWLSFSEPAQDMAWRGFTPEEILGAAVNTSGNTSVRATGYSVAELAGIEPLSLTEANSSYSPFADDAFNAKLHEKAVHAVFEDVIAQGLRQRSADPFLSIANSQNESLTEGQILGWCASALQAAGRAFQRALEGGYEPEPNVRREFYGEQGSTSWSDLRALGKSVIKEYRSGNVVTLNRLEQLCTDEKAFASIRKAILGTMRDPQYVRKMNAVKELTMEAPRPGPEPAPRARPAAPSPALVSVPGASSGMSGAQSSRPPADSGGGAKETA